MLSPIPPLGSFSPVNPVTPFTYRDNATFLTILHTLEDYVRVLTQHVNESDATNSSNLSQGISDLTNALNLALMNFQAEMTELVESSHDEGIATNPTTGSRADSVSKVIGDVYDNARVFAYFAKDYDDLELTAAQYDALNFTARHYDLGVTYPTINDTLEP